MKLGVLILTLAAVLLAAVPAFAGYTPERLVAQAAMDTKMKLIVANAALTEAEKMLQEGKRNEARFHVLAVTNIMQSLARYQDGQALVQKFISLEQALWPEAATLTQDKLPQLFAEFRKTFDEYRPGLTRYGIKMDFQTPKHTMSFEQWAAYVIEAIDAYPEAYKYAVEYASKVPMPELHLSQPAMNMGAYTLMPSLLNILLCEAYTTELGKQDILPRSLKKAAEVLSSITPDEKSPGTLIRAADDIGRYAGYALKIDKGNAQAKEYQKKAEQIVERAQKLYAAMVDTNRMPSDSYSGPEKEATRAAMRKAYEKAFPEEKVLEVAIIGSDWVERAEAWANSDGSVSSGIFRYLDGAIAVQKKDGRYWVFTSRFARQWTGRGDTFGDIYHNRPLSTSYEIRKENI